MSAEEEVEEHLHHAHNPFDKTVAGTMAIIAALLAVVSVAGQHYITEELLRQAQASDQWAYYQAKDIRRFTAEATRDTLGELKQSAPSAKTYDQDAKKYRKDSESIQEKARDLEHERDRAGKKANSFHFGEIFLEVAIVLSSLAILMKVKPLFFAGVGAALVGVVIALTAWWA
jgi:glucan-binding YG repeat protein